MKDVISISPDSVAGGYRKLGRAVVTRGTPREVSNQDGAHGIETLPVVSGPEFQVWLARFQILGLPMILHVSNIQVRSDVSFRCLNFFGLVQIHVVIRDLGGRWRQEPHFISHPLLKFTHRFLDKSRFVTDMGYRSSK